VTDPGAPAVATAGAAALGVGMSSQATGTEVRHAADAALADAGLRWADVGCVATLATLAADRRVVALGVPVAGYAADVLAAVTGVEPSDRSAAAVGTPSVAEAAALLASGPAGVLVVRKRRSGRVTVAVAAVGAHHPGGARDPGGAGSAIGAHGAEIVR
jgi:cobalamin biosynthesis protein CbiG